VGGDLTETRKFTGDQVERRRGKESELPYLAIIPQAFVGYEMVDSQLQKARVE